MEQKIVKWYPLSFRGQNVKVIGDRIDSWNHEQGFVYYEFQSTNEDWTRPSTLCSSVRLNFWGMMACPRPLEEIDRVRHITLTDSEVKAILAAMAGRPCTIQRDTRDMESQSRHQARML